MSLIRRDQCKSEVESKATNEAPKSLKQDVDSLFRDMPEQQQEECSDCMPQNEDLLVRAQQEREQTRYSKEMEIGQLLNFCTRI